MPFIAEFYKQPKVKPLALALIAAAAAEGASLHDLAVGLLAGDAGIHIDMVREQHNPFPAGILLDLDQLRLRGKLGLVVGGDANVCRGKGGGLRSGHGDHPFGVDD